MSGPFQCFNTTDGRSLMSMFELDASAPRVARAPVPLSDLDGALTAQIIVAWAGESGENGATRRLGW